MADTICIAAVCRENSEPRIVLCSDTQMTYADIAKWEGAKKCHPIYPGWFAMIAGDAARAKEIIDRYIEHLDYAGPANLSTDSIVLASLRRPIKDQKRSDIDEYVISQLGMTFQEFLQDSAKFPDAVRADIFSEVRRLDFGCSIMIAGFIQGVARIYSTVAGSLIERDTMCAIGCGEVAAFSSMSRRQYHADLDIHEAIYYIYEAKRASEGIPGVGKETNLLILAPMESTKAHHTRSVGSAGFAILKKQEARFGIRRFSMKSAPKRLPLEECNIEWKHLELLAASGAVQSDPQLTTRDSKSPLPSQE
jgi:20S proteasome alpha/beta subunit